MRPFTTASNPGGTGTSCLHIIGSSSSCSRSDLFFRPGRIGRRERGASPRCDRLPPPQTPAVRVLHVSTSLGHPPRVLPLDLTGVKIDLLHELIPAQQFLGDAAIETDVRRHRERLMTGVLEINFTDIFRDVVREVRAGAQHKVSLREYDFLAFPEHYFPQSMEHVGKEFGGRLA